MKREVSPEGVLLTHWLRQEKRLRNKVVLIDAANDSSWTAQELTEATSPFADHLRQYRAGERIDGIERRCVRSTVRSGERPPRESARHCANGLF